MSEEMNEYITFTITAGDGTEVEMAVVDEFEFEKRNYVAAAKVVGDTIDEEGIFIYRVKETEDDFTVDKIKSQVEYQRVCKAYMEMED